MLSDRFVVTGVERGGGGPYESPIAKEALSKRGIASNGDMWEGAGVARSITVVSSGGKKTVAFSRVADRGVRKMIATPGAKGKITITINDVDFAIASTRIVCLDDITIYGYEKR